MDASIVIPAYKARETISACLDALALQVTSLSHEIIVVDSAGDGTGDLVRGRYPHVRMIESPTRLLSGAARNLGAEHATGDLLYFIDADCIAEPRWIEKMAASIERYGCSAVSGAMLNGNPEHAISVSSYVMEFSDFYAWGRPRFVDYLVGGNLCYRQEVFHRYGGFDPNQPLYVDLIFNKRLSAAGEKLLFDPTISVHHLHRTTARVYLRHERGRGKAAVAARRLGMLIGASWVRYPVLAFLAAPGLFARKAAVFPYRFLRAYPGEAARLVRALPWFYTALVVWHYGFLHEVVAGRHLNRRQEAVEWTTN